MAVPNYTEDLTDIDLAEATTNYVAYGGGAAGLGAGADFSMQGTNAIDKQITSAEKGMLFNNGAGITMTAGDHTFIWSFAATPGVTDLYNVRGSVVCIGSSATAFVKYTIDGLDTYGASGRVGKCTTIDQTIITANTGSIPYRTLVGSPSGALQYFGAGLNTTATVKSANLGLDAQRYGTGAYITAGEIANPATFNGFSIQNDAVANRWGILGFIGGSYELQGRFVIGQNNSKTATLAYFEDSDVNIVLVDTVHAASDFTQIIIDHASTILNWNNIGITALGTINPGRFIVNSANPAVSIIGGTWTNIGITILRSNSTINGLTWRNTDQITQNTAIITDCIFDVGNIATTVPILVVNDITKITSCSFASSGAGYAIEGFATAGDYTLTSLDFSGYATDAGTAGNRAIHVTATTGTVNLTVAGGTTPSIHSDGATVNVIANAVPLTITVLDDEDSSAIEGAAVTISVSDGTGDYPFEESVTITQTGGTATVTHTAHGLSTNQKVIIDGANENNYNRIKTITVTGINAYTYPIDSGTTSPATGTIISTAVIIDGITNVSGVISDTRVYSVNQPVTGLVQRGTKQPIYKARNYVATIDKDTGTSSPVLLTKD